MPVQEHLSSPQILNQRQFCTMLGRVAFVFEYSLLRSRVGTILHFTEFNYSRVFLSCSPEWPILIIFHEGKIYQAVRNNWSFSQFHILGKSPPETPQRYQRGYPCHNFQQVSRIPTRTFKSYSVSIKIPFLGWLPRCTCHTWPSWGELWTLYYVITSTLRATLSHIEYYESYHIYRITIIFISVRINEGSVWS